MGACLKQHCFIFVFAISAYLNGVTAQTAPRDPAGKEGYGFSRSTHSEEIAQVHKPVSLSGTHNGTFAKTSMQETWNAPSPSHQTPAGFLTNHKSRLIHRLSLLFSEPISDMPTVRVCGIAFVVALLILLALIRFRGKRKLNRGLKDEKRAIIIGPEQDSMQCGEGDEAKPLSRCFREAGFGTYEMPDLKGLAGYLSSVSPHLLAVDVRVDGHAVSKVERVLRRKGPLSNIPVLFCNVEGLPATTPRPAVGLLRNAWHIGARINNAELREIIAPLMSTGDSQRPGTTTLQTAVNALQGRIIDDSLQEVLSFMEMGGKTGCLLVETSQPYGMLYFDRGVIINAATKTTTGMKAALEMLEIRRGIFRFAPEKKPAESNCTIAVAAVLLEFAKRADEAAQKKQKRRSTEVLRRDG
ncbi:MAG: DUF4388 domain-containing protein [Chitinivibrionales bacterium]|nr:DUF4388 domain-containing protein [Chitinivibrionales bacterium]MBD3357478.1 DUF4388 domain-containing protein [Chitinivibrionales bacterium]